MGEAPKLGKSAGNRGKGRKPGSRNRVTIEVKQAILKAFDDAGGAGYLLTVAQDDPKTFCALLGRIVPTEISADVTVATDFADKLRAARERSNAG